MSKAVKIVHCSDLHLDRTFNISNFALAMDRKNDLNRNFATVVDFAIDKKAASSSWKISEDFTMLASVSS